MNGEDGLNMFVKFDNASHKTMIPVVLRAVCDGGEILPLTWGLGRERQIESYLVSQSWTRSHSHCSMSSKTVPWC